MGINMGIDWKYIEIIDNARKIRDSVKFKKKEGEFIILKLALYCSKIN